MNKDFVGFGLRQTILKALDELGYQRPTPVQDAVISPLMEGRDVIAQAKTGTGKTAAFALPALQNIDSDSKSTQVLVLSPTRELAKQVGQAFGDYAKHENISVLTIYGGASYGYQKSVLKKGAQVVVGTPGRLLDLAGRGSLNLKNIKLLVLDEADEMLSMGFTEEVEELLSYLPSNRQNALFSATLPQEIKNLAKKVTRDPFKINLSKELSTKSVSLRAYMVKPQDKVAALTRIFETEDVSTALVFCRTRHQTSELAAKLTSLGIPAEALSGALEQDAREMVLRRFRNQTFTVLVATDVAARGLDIEHLSYVVNLDLPQNPETFVHRVGRVGRAGRTGVALTFITPKEDWKLSRIERALKRPIERCRVPSKKEITRKRMESLYTKMAKWLESDRCKKELSYVEEMQAAGYDAKKIAAAAIKLAAATQKANPIAEMTEWDSPESHQKHKSKHQRSGRARKGDGTGMIANVGRSQGLKVKEMIAILTRIAKVPAKGIGDVRISKTRCFVNISDRFVKRVLEKNKSYKLGRHKFKFEIDR